MISPRALRPRTRGDTRRGRSRCRRSGCRRARGSSRTTLGRRAGRPRRRTPSRAARRAGIASIDMRAENTKTLELARATKSPLVGRLAGGQCTPAAGVGAAPQECRARAAQCDSRLPSFPPLARGVCYVSKGFEMGETHEHNEPSSPACLMHEFVDELLPEPGGRGPDWPVVQAFRKASGPSCSRAGAPSSSTTASGTQQP